MISRRILRVKVLQMLYAFHKNEKQTIGSAERELFFSIGKTYDLYHYLLLLIVEMQQLSEKKITAAKEKLVPTHEDLNPNTRFVDNLVIQQLKDNIQLNSYAEKNTINWSEQVDFLRLLHQQLLASDLYQNYMNSEDSNYESDSQFVQKFFIRFLAENDDFYTMLEENNIYWNDESEFVISMVVKTIKSLKQSDDQNFALPSLFKDEEDEMFVRDLFRNSLLGHSDNVSLIDSFTKNWEVDRIAFMDVIIMEMALVELTEFNSIPVNVTLNEYLEIAKCYSTDKSSAFINGILDKILKKLSEEGKINKTGKGLIGTK